MLESALSGGYFLDELQKFCIRKIDTAGPAEIKKVDDHWNSKHPESPEKRWIQKRHPLKDNGVYLLSATDHLKVYVFMARQNGRLGEEVKALGIGNWGLVTGHQSLVIGRKKLKK